MYMSHAVRQVLIDWEIQCPSQRSCLVIGEENGGVPKEGTATMLAIEFAGADAEGKKGKKAKVKRQPEFTLSLCIYIPLAAEDAIYLMPERTSTDAFP